MYMSLSNLREMVKDREAWCDGHDSVTEQQIILHLLLGYHIHLTVYSYYCCLVAITLSSLRAAAVYYSPCILSPHV